MCQGADMCSTRPLGPLRVLVVRRSSRRSSSSSACPCLSVHSWRTASPIGRALEIARRYQTRARALFRAAPAAQAAIARTTDLASVNSSGMLGHVQSGVLRALVQTGKERWSEMPDAIRHSRCRIGNDEFLLVLAGTPQAIVHRLSSEVLVILQKPVVRDRMLKASFAERRGT